jgi:hypothetical protein
VYGTEHNIGDWVRISGDDLDDVGREVHGDLAEQVGRVFLIDLNHSCGSNQDGIDGQNTDPLYHVGLDDGRNGVFYSEELIPVEPPKNPV